MSHGTAGLSPLGMEQIPSHAFSGFAAACGIRKAAPATEAAPLSAHRHEAGSRPGSAGTDYE